MDYEKNYLAVSSFLKETPSLKVNINNRFLARHDASSRERVAKNLAEFRKALNVSQSRVAELIDISLSQYKKYESGLENIRYDVAACISLRFGLPMTHLYKGSIYAQYLELPVDYYNGYDKIWFYINSMSDEYFEKLCRILHCLVGSKALDFSIEKYSITLENYELALDENKNDIYYILAQSLKIIRKHFNISQEEAADAVELSLSSYQAYEKLSNRPRFNLFVAARFTVSAQLPSGIGLIGTEFIKLKKLQNSRIEKIQTILADVDANTLKNISPFIDSFYEMITKIPAALLFDL